MGVNVRALAFFEFKNSSDEAEFLQDARVMYDEVQSDPRYKGKILKLFYKKPGTKEYVMCLFFTADGSQVHETRELSNAAREKHDGFVAAGKLEKGVFLHLPHGDLPKDPLPPGVVSGAHADYLTKWKEVLATRQMADWCVKLF